jgi:hypothetical protein
MDLALIGSESDVGDFSIDVLARDLGGNRLVVIDNQHGQTEHTHLGQVLTDAAGVDAGVVVWVMFPVLPPASLFTRKPIARARHPRL